MTTSSTPTGRCSCSGWSGSPSSVLVLLARRRFPFAAPAATWLVCAALSFMDGQLIVNGAGILIAGMGAAVLLGTVRNASLARLGLVIAMAGALTVVRNAPDSTTDDLISVPVMFALGWLVGWALRERTERTEAAEERARLAERRAGGGRPGGGGGGARPDRARAARRRRPRRERDRAAGRRRAAPDAGGAPQPTARRCATSRRRVVRRSREMRRLLAAMRDDDDAPELAPHPGLDDLDRLVRDVRAAGLDVRVEVRGLPPSSSRAAWTSRRTASSRRRSPTASSTPARTARR